MSAPGGAEASASPPGPTPPPQGVAPTTEPAAGGCRRRGRLAAGGLLAALGGALALLALLVERSPCAPDYPGPAPLPPALAARLDYPERGRPAPEVAAWSAPGPLGDERWLKLDVTTPGFPPHTVQVIDIRADLPGRRPAVVVSPILGGRAALAQLIAHGLARRGFHTAVVLPSLSLFDPDDPPEALDGALRTAVVDRRRTLDWLAGRADVDPGRLGAVGISAGALITAALLAVDDRVGAALLALGGGDLAEVVLTSDEPRLRAYVAAQAARGCPPARLAVRLRAALPFDVLELAPVVDARRVLFVSARRDRTVPYETQTRLWEALGRPARVSLPTDHYLAALYLPWLIGVTADFLEERLGR